VRIPAPRADSLILFFVCDFVGTHDTTVRLKYTLTTHPTLTTPAALSAFLSSFGETDTSAIVLSLKPKAQKKAAQNPPKPTADRPLKYGTALVPFKKIGDAFNAVCASGNEERGLGGVDVAWVEGKEPPILGWLRKLGKLEVVVPSAPAHENENDDVERPKQSRHTVPVVGGLDYESLTLMRLRQAEREKMEKEIREQEEGDVS
jgi:DnaJ homolog subfamily C member 17